MEFNNHIYKWIEAIKLAQPKLGQFSVCPYATKAKTVNIQILESVDQKFDLDINNIDVKIFVLNYEISESDLDALCSALNSNNLDLVFLPDHKDSTFNIQGIITGNQKYNLILCQKRSELNHYRNILQKTSYYKYWDQELLDKIFSF